MKLLACLNCGDIFSLTYNLKTCTCGKTSLATTMVNNATTIFKAKVAFYSLEMPGKQLAARLISQVTDISSKDVLYRRLNEYQLKEVERGIGVIQNSKIYFDDNSTSSVEGILKSIRMMKIKYDIDIFVIDYLQLVRSNVKGMMHEQQIADIVRNFKNIAKELKICGIVLSQLSRNADNPRPTLARLRGSGQIEEAADQVIFTYRPQYYNEKFNKNYEYPEGLNTYSTEGTAMIDIAKGRNTGTFSFICGFDAERTHFYSLEDKNLPLKNTEDEPF